MKFFLGISAFIIFAIAAVFSFSKLSSIESYIPSIPLPKDKIANDITNTPTNSAQAVARTYPKITEKKPAVNNTGANTAEIQNKEQNNTPQETVVVTETPTTLVPKKEIITPNEEPIVIKYVRAASNSFLTESGVITFTNKNRADSGLPTLQSNSLLQKSAQMKLQDMFDQQYFAHVGPDGNGPSFWVTAAGYDYKSTGENLALGNFENDDMLVQGWMESPGHRANILNTKFTQIGVAVGKGMYEGQETWLAVQEFGKPMPECAEPEQVLKDQAEANDLKIKDLQQQLEALQQEIDSAEDPKYHNQKVDEYNALIPTYNDLIDITKAFVDKFNAEISAYNACIVQ